MQLKKTNLRVVATRSTSHENKSFKISLKMVKNNERNHRNVFTTVNVIWSIVYCI